MSNPTGGSWIVIALVHKRMKLIDQEDKFPVFSSIVEYFAVRMNDMCLAGTWNSTSVRDLWLALLGIE